MESQLAKTTNGFVEYTLTGNGPVVLVCHGTSSDCFATELAQHLANAGFSVLTPSRPGYGHTPLAVGRSAAQSAEAFITLLDHLHIAEISVLAISGGGPTGIALAAGFPERVKRLVLGAAVSQPESRRQQPNYKDQMAFYGPMHGLTWGMLGLMSRISPRQLARQTLVIFSTHDPDDGLRRLSAGDIQEIAHFYQGHSSRSGAINDDDHTVGQDTLQSIDQPTLVIHSREDRSVPFSHAEWSLKNIPHAELCEAGFSGHFFWIGPDFDHIKQRMIDFLIQD